MSFGGVQERVAKATGVDPIVDLRDPKGKPPPPPGSASSPASITAVNVTKAREDLKLRLRRAASRGGSNITGVGLLNSTLNIQQQTLGKG